MYDSAPAMATLRLGGEAEFVLQLISEKTER